MKKKYFVWTHYDLDGVVSYLNVRWGLNKPIPYKTSTPKNFREDFTQWLVHNNIEDYDKIFILDLDVSDNKDLIDRKNFMIIDHHESHVKNSDYKRATAIIKEYKSAAELVYKVFKKLTDVKLTTEQKKLILFASDYDSYTLDLEDSSKLNTLFWNTSKGFESFVRNFSKGFHGYSLEQENIIKFYVQKLLQLKEQIKVYANKIKIQGKERYVCATFAEKNTNEIADILMNEYNAEIAFVVNVKSNHVSIRRPKNVTDVNLSILAESLIDGAGHQYASGGVVTKKFCEFTKLLKQIK